MFKELRTAFVVLLVLTILTGVLYPFAVTGLAQAVFPGPANGSLILAQTDRGEAVVLGSQLIGQPFDDAKYFWSRPSATAPVPYNASSSTGSNQGPTNPDLAKALKERVEKLRAMPGGAGPIPSDLVTSSGSGLDPHISPAAARFQIARVAAARGLAVESVQNLVEQHVESRWLGVLGEPRVNVLELNLALDAASRR